MSSSSQRSASVYLFISLMATKISFCHWGIWVDLAIFGFDAAGHLMRCSLRELTNTLHWNQLGESEVYLSGHTIWKASGAFQSFYPCSLSTVEWVHCQRNSRIADSWTYLPWWVSCVQWVVVARIKVSSWWCSRNEGHTSHANRVQILSVISWLISNQILFIVS